MVGDSPLARAVRTKSDDSTASIEARVMRAIGASEKIAKVSTGRINWLSAERDAGGGGDAAEMVDPGAGPGRGENAERNGDHDRDDEPEQRQLGGGRQPV